MTEEGVKRLIAFIEDHPPAKVDGYVMEDDQVTKLYVSTIWLDQDGIAFRNSEIIDATWEAAKEWLNY